LQTGRSGNALQNLQIFGRARTHVKHDVFEREHIAVLPPNVFDSINSARNSKLIC